MNIRYPIYEGVYRILTKNWTWNSWSDHRARTEGAGHPYQPGNIRETSGTGHITKQGGQVRS